MGRTANGGEGRRGRALSDRGKQTVFVGLSGGVDSSVAAKLLQDAGYRVVGVYMKNWSEDLPGMKCPWAEDLADAKRVAVKLGVDFLVFDFEKAYFDKVVKYMIDEYKLGRTPNPDVVCNEEIKFKLFFEECLKRGADLVATGHYARVRGRELWRAVDERKDQTYFLYRVSGEALAKTIFPVGDFLKTEVKQMARDFGLRTADKPESMGVCFVGNVGLKEFLGRYVAARCGDVVDEGSGKVIGQHMGAEFYTLGQRHGLYLGGGLPYYVSGKDMKRNVVLVTTDLNGESLWQTEVVLEKLHFINGEKASGRLKARVRHQAPLVDVDLTWRGEKALAVFGEKTRVVPAGQSVVLYDGEVCLGGGVVG
jgi:tRNA-specific 2-thiouridylase